MLVSILIPSYNHHSYVAEAIASVLAQAPSVDFDLIVIDDGSTDGSPAIIQKLWETSKNFRFISRDNRGLIATLNEGLRLARGEFFCELASDDYFPLGSLQLRRDYLLQHPDCIAVFADGYRVQGDSKTGTKILDEKRRKLFALPDPIPTMLSGVQPVFSTGMIRTEILRRCGGFDEENFRFYEDLDTPVRLALAGKIGFLDTPVICRREHQTNVSGTTQHVRVEKVACYCKMLQDPAMQKYRQLLHRRLCRSLLSLGRSMNGRAASESEKRMIRFGWKYIWREPRLFPYLLRWGRI